MEKYSGLGIFIAVLLWRAMNVFETISSLVVFLCLGIAYPEPYLILYRNVSISILVIGTIEFFGATEGAVEVQEIKPTKVPGSLQIVGNICKNISC